MNNQVSENAFDDMRWSIQYRNGLGMFDSDLAAAESVAEHQIVEEEAPLVVDSSKPFNMKKFRDSLRKPDCIMGKKDVVSRS